MSLPKQIPETEYEFEIDVEGNTTKSKYSGNFKGLIPTNKMRSAQKRKESAMNIGLESEVNKKQLGLMYDPILDLHYKISYLFSRLTDVPVWFKDAGYGENLMGDINLIDELYNKVLEAEDAWYEKIWGDKSK